MNHKCGFDCSSVHVSKIVKVTRIIDSDLFGREIIEREVCPCCAEHIQGDNGEFYDCKNVFWDGMVPAEEHDAIPNRMVRKSVGQCMCYGPAHGVRKGR